MYAPKITVDQAKELAKEMFKGCDRLYKPHMKEVNDGFKRSNGSQRQREKLMKDLAEM